MLTIRQSYHGTGGKEGYKFEVLNSYHEFIGELEEFPLYTTHGTLLSIDGRLYELVNWYDSGVPEEEKYETVYYELESFIVAPDYDLGYINRDKNKRRVR